MAIWIGRLALAPLMVCACGAGPASATEGVAALDGSTLGLWWALPFAGLLLSVAAVPQLAPHFWHQHFGKVAAAWALLFLLPFAATYGMALAAGEVLHVALGEYLPFVILLFALFVISGGVRVRSNMVGTPAINTGILAFGAALASVTGTTGAAMLLVRPLIQANLKRRHNAHVLVFFIFLVANIGGSLTPLGDQCRSIPMEYPHQPFSPGRTPRSRAGTWAAARRRTSPCSPGTTACGCRARWRWSGP